MDAFIFFRKSNSISFYFSVYLPTYLLTYSYVYCLINDIWIKTFGKYTFPNQPWSSVAHRGELRKRASSKHILYWGNTALFINANTLVWMWEWNKFVPQVLGWWQMTTFNNFKQLVLVISWPTFDIIFGMFLKILSV